jgi:CHAD domain-containing protein
MRPNGPSHRGQVIPVEQESRKILLRMRRYLGRLAKHPDTENVHRFRTNSRRVEAIVSELAPDTRNRQKLLKQLSKLRKKAGRLRDLDVQLAFLKDLKMSDHQNHRSALMHRLRDEQERHGRKLAKNLTYKRVNKIRKRLSRSLGEMQFDGIDPLQLAWQWLPKLPAASVTQQQLHACRIAAKRARYLAELAGDSADAKTFIDHLKRAQDEIGQWHDVLKLEERAKDLFGGVRDSALVSLLQNITGARFRRATAALLEAMRAIENMRRKPSAPAPNRAEPLFSEAAA